MSSRSSRRRRGDSPTQKLTPDPPNPLHGLSAEIPCNGLEHLTLRAFSNPLITYHVAAAPCVAQSLQVCGKECRGYTSIRTARVSVRESGRASRSSLPQAIFWRLVSLWEDAIRGQPLATRTAGLDDDVGQTGRRQQSLSQNLTGWRCG